MLYGNTQDILEGVLEDLKTRNSVVGIGLFGSWIRGDAVSKSDIDLLVIEDIDFNYEYVERAEIEGLFLDLDHIPQKWILKQFPPAIDQKLNEAKILYDLEGKFGRAKDLMSKIRWTPERVEIRTGTFIMESDTYFSRGLSAFNKDDLESAKANSIVGLDAIMKILLEVNKEPISFSHFLRSLELVTKKLGTKELYDLYLDLTGLTQIDHGRVENMLASISEMWKEIIKFVCSSSSLVETLHVRVRNDLGYYCKQNFLRGMYARTSSLIEEGAYAEAAHYMFRTSISMLENYVWLLSKIEKNHFDYTDLFQRLKYYENSKEKIYRKAIEASGLEGITVEATKESLQRTKDVMLGIRKRRKEYIAALLS